MYISFFAIVNSRGEKQVQEYLHAVINHLLCISESLTNWVIKWTNFFTQSVNDDDDKDQQEEHSTMNRAVLECLDHSPSKLKDIDKIGVWKNEKPEF